MWVGVLGGSIKVTPTEVVTHRAAVYPKVLGELAPAAWHHMQQYADNWSNPIMAGLSGPPTHLHDQSLPRETPTSRAGRARAGAAGAAGRGGRLRCAAGAHATTPASGPARLIASAAPWGPHLRKRHRLAFDGVVGRAMSFALRADEAMQGHLLGSPICASPCATFCI
jgi:hypothetical protein